MGIQDQVVVVTIKGFNNGDEYVGKGTAITVTESRAKELEANGLITRDADAVKLAQGVIKPPRRPRRASSAAVKRAQAALNKQSRDPEGGPAPQASNKQAADADKPGLSGHSDKGNGAEPQGGNGTSAEGGQAAAASDAANDAATAATAATAAGASGGGAGGDESKGG